MKSLWSSSVRLKLHSLFSIYFSVFEFHVISSLLYLTLSRWYWLFSCVRILGFLHLFFCIFVCFCNCAIKLWPSALDKAADYGGKKWERRFRMSLLPFLTFSFLQSTYWKVDEKSKKLTKLPITIFPYMTVWKLPESISCGKKYAACFHSVATSCNYLECDNFTAWRAVLKL